MRHGTAPSRRTRSPHDPVHQKHAPRSRAAIIGVDDSEMEGRERRTFRESFGELVTDDAEHFRTEHEKDAHVDKGSPETRKKPPKDSSDRATTSFPAERPSSQMEDKRALWRITCRREGSPAPILEGHTGAPLQEKSTPEGSSCHPHRRVCTRWAMHGFTPHMQTREMNAELCGKRLSCACASETPSVIT